MKIIYTLILTILIFTNLHGQSNKEEQAIVDEGKKLYKSEMASWYGTDLFLEKFPDKRNNIGGYFSYADGDIEKCVFFSNSELPKVLATISFDSTYNTGTAKVDITDRGFNSYENDIYVIRKIALNEIKSDTLFKQRKNTDFNLIPLLGDKLKKVYVLTGPQEANVVIFGNDYLLTFDKNNKLASKKQLHKNIIPINYSNDGKIDGKDVRGTMHTHLPETGELITSTDICTLMLYEKFAKWKTHYVVGEKMMNIWDCEKNTLLFMSKDALDKIYKDQEQRHN